MGEAKAGSLAVCPGLGDASTGLEVTGLDEEAGVSEVEGVGEGLQPSSTISTLVSNHRVFTFELNPPLPLLCLNPESREPVGKAYAERIW